jgi:hypothetical protein
MGRNVPPWYLLSFGEVKKKTKKKEAGRYFQRLKP